MIVDDEDADEEGKIRGGMLIDWDCCKSIDEGSARQNARTVSYMLEVV
jgi:hypothetical protein